MKQKLFFSLLLIVSLLTACNFNKDNEQTVSQLKPSTVIIKIGDENITKTQFDESFNKIYSASPFSKAQIDLKDPKNIRVKLLFRSKAINDLFTRYFIEQEAKKRNIKVTEEDITSYMNEIILRIGGKARLLDQLATIGKDENSFRNSLKEDILAKKTIDAITNNLTVTDDDIKKYYEEHKLDKFDIPESVRVSHIFFDADPKDIFADLSRKNPNLKPTEAEINKIIEDKKIKAKQILATLNTDPSSFDELAENESEDRLSAIHDGDLGYFPRGKLQEPIDNVVFDSQKVQVGRVYPAIIQSSAGFHIIKVTDHKKKGIIPFESVKNDIKTILADLKKIDALSKFVNDKKSTTKIDFVYEGFSPDYINDKLNDSSSNPSLDATADIKPNSNSNNN